MDSMWRPFGNNYLLLTSPIWIDNINFSKHHYRWYDLFELVVSSFCFELMVHVSPIQVDFTHLHFNLIPKFNNEWSLVQTYNNYTIYMYMYKAKNVISNTLYSTNNSFFSAYFSKWWFTSRLSHFCHSIFHKGSLNLF